MAHPISAAPACAQAGGVAPFARTLEAHGLVLARDAALTLQVNAGLLCNLACRHCHLEAGPARPEVMGAAVMRQVAEHARRNAYAAIDVTGGAPELVPGMAEFMAELAPLAGRVMFRTNLLAMAREESRELLDTLAAHGVALVASLPSLSASQAEAQRGGGVLDGSLAMLRRLNGMGYGAEGSGLELDLVSNPVGAFLPPGQEEAERRFKADLARRRGITFNRLYVFANVPLGRYRRWLEASGNYGGYMRRLAEAFNPCALGGLMCRTLVSVGWDGRLSDCDFNLAAGLPLGGEDRSVADLDRPPAPGARIAMGDHCYACTAGAGFT
ncbi:MAG: arsenosugar biosynthesis radical SAM (seleno)protein ArsS [Thermodesulfobacteriota bacterium]